MRAAIIAIFCFLNFQSVLSRKCAYFPKHPDLSVVSFKSCAYEQSCYEGFTSDSEMVCSDYGYMWWLLFIVIAAVVFLVVACVLIYCLVKKSKALKAEKTANNANNKTSNDYALNAYKTENKTFEISDKNDDLLVTPNYVSLFEKQASTIGNVENNAVPVLPATHLVDKNSFDVFNTPNNNELQINNVPIKPRRLTPINTNNA